MTMNEIHVAPQPKRRYISKEEHSRRLAQRRYEVAVETLRVSSEKFPEEARKK